MTTKLNLTLKRSFRGPEYTIGHLYINDKFFCDTLEGRDRGLRASMGDAEVVRLKAPGETAIPTGEYEVSMKWQSTKFKQKSWARPYGGIVPRIMNVPGFSGVLIHPGNTKDDTEGCVLVGENKVKGKVINSVDTYHRLMQILMSVETITLTIV